jgi:hydroxymethylpyrimidine/phosphomethylpyrimidine kinase
VKRREARVLVVSGLDPAGRAGLLADAAAIRNLGAIPLAVASALTAQGSRTFATEPAPPRILSKQLKAVLELGPVHAVKLGMIPSRASLRAIQEALSRPDVPWVVDPVVRTSRGEPLSRLTARDYRSIASQRMVITPNAFEAGWLLGEARAPRGVAEALSAAERLRASGFGAVVLKGGHLRGPPADVLVVEGSASIFEGRRLRRRADQRGTGCRFASSLAVFLARGEPLEAAVRAAKREVEKYLQGAERAPRAK